MTLVICLCWYVTFFIFACLYVRTLQRLHLSRTRAGIKSDYTSHTTARIRCDAATEKAAGNSFDWFPTIYASSNADYRWILFIVQVKLLYYKQLLFQKSDIQISWFNFQFKLLPPLQKKIFCFFNDTMRFFSKSLCRTDSHFFPILKIA